MSYVKLNPSYYQMFQPESAWHAGAEGWSVAPYTGWGMNPNLVGPKRLAVEGLGAVSPGLVVAGQIAVMAGIIGVALYLTK
jgi:hypothetical protein